jgi:hypothetical protein
MSRPDGPPPPVFPGGMESAPELTPGGCAHDPCLCGVEPGRRFCAPACAWAPADAETCDCGHFGCTNRGS